MANSDPNAGPLSLGTLAERPLPQLLIYALDQQFSGSLELSAEDGKRATIVFSEGYFIRVKVNFPAPSLGQVLYELGAIGFDTMNVSLAAVARRGLLHGQVLLGEHCITQAQLNVALREQMRRKVNRLFWFGPTSTFTIYDNVDTLSDYGGADWPTCDPRPSIWIGIRDFTEPSAVKAAISKVEGMHFRLRTSSSLSRYQLSAEETSAAECLRIRPMTVAELLAAEVAPERETSALFLLLLALSDLEFVQLGNTRPGDSDGPLPPSISQRVSFDGRAEPIALVPPTNSGPTKQATRSGPRPRVTEEQSAAHSTRAAGTKRK